MLTDNPKLSIIIVSFNVCSYLIDCLQSIFDSTNGIDYEIIVVDNASCDNSVEAVKQSFPNVKLITNKENVGFANANNQGYEEAKGDYILLLNPDTIVKQNAIHSTLDFLQTKAKAGMVACRLLNADNSLQKSVYNFPSISHNLLSAFLVDRFFNSHYQQTTYYMKQPHKIDYACGAFLMIKKRALGDMTLLSPDFFMYSEEKELALRLKKGGWDTYFVPFGEIIHYGGASTSQLPIEMFIELYRSNIKFFVNHYSPIRAFALCLSLSAVLVTRLFFSIPFFIFKNSRYRIKLYSIVLFNFPKMLLNQFSKSKRR